MNYVIYDRMTDLYFSVEFVIDFTILATMIIHSPGCVVVWVRI